MESRISMSEFSGMERRSLKYSIVPLSSTPLMRPLPPPLRPVVSYHHTSCYQHRRTNNRFSFSFLSAFGTGPCFVGVKLIRN